MKKQPFAQIENKLPAKAYQKNRSSIGIMVHCISQTAKRQTKYFSGSLNASIPEGTFWFQISRKQVNTQPIDFDIKEKRNKEYRKP